MNSELAELKEQCNQLRAQTQTLRIALLIVALAVAGFFWLEARRNSQALVTMRPQAAQIAEVTQKQLPAITNFLHQMSAFGRTHPDFAPVITKHQQLFPRNPAPVAPKK